MSHDTIFNSMYHIPMGFFFFIIFQGVLSFLAGKRHSSLELLSFLPKMMFFPEKKIIFQSHKKMLIAKIEDQGWARRRVKPHFGSIF